MNKKKATLLAVVVVAVIAIGYLLWAGGEKKQRVQA